jgi:hypothetical protein
VHPPLTDFENSQDSNERYQMAALASYDFEVTLGQIFINFFKLRRLTPPVQFLSKFFQSFLLLGCLVKIMSLYAEIIHLAFEGTTFTLPNRINNGNAIRYFRF